MLPGQKAGSREAKEPTPHRVYQCEHICECDCVKGTHFFWTSLTCSRTCLCASAPVGAATVPLVAASLDPRPCACGCAMCVLCCFLPRTTAFLVLAGHRASPLPHTNVATRSFRFGSGSGGGSGGGSSGSPALLHRGSLGAASNPNPYPKKKLARVHFLIYFPEHKNDFLEKSGSENQGPDYYFTGTPLFLGLKKISHEHEKGFLVSPTLLP